MQEAGTVTVLFNCLLLDQASAGVVLQYGDIFTVSLGGQKMTYLLHPAAMKLFFSAPDDQIAFRQACVFFTNRVFGLP